MTEVGIPYAKVIGHRYYEIVQCPTCGEEITQQCSATGETLVNVYGVHHAERHTARAPLCPVCGGPFDDNGTCPHHLGAPITFAVGDRIICVRTEDPHTLLEHGDKGTVTRVDATGTTLGVKWDSGSTLSMLLDEGDAVVLDIPSPA